MPGAYLWIWSDTEGDFVKAKADASGRLEVAISVNNLGDIGDIDLTGIADDDIIYWDDAAGKWKPIAHLGVANAHHTKYTNANAVSAMGALANGNPLNHNRTVKYTNNEAVAAVEATGLALASGKNIKVISALITDHTWSGRTAIMTAGIALTRTQAVCVGGDSKMELADKDGTGTMPAIALCTPATLAENAAGVFLMQGFFRDDTWDWTIRGILYIGDNGALTQDISGYTTGDQVQVVGVAITADIIHFNPSYELVEIS